MNPVRCPLAVSRFESSSWGFALNSSSERKLRPSPKAPALVSGSTGVDLDFEMLLRADLADLADALFDDPVCTGLSRLRELMATYACTTSRPLFRPAALGTSFFFTSHHTEQEKIRKSSSSPSNVGSYFFKKRTTERGLYQLESSRSRSPYISAAGRRSSFSMLRFDLNPPSSGELSVSKQTPPKALAPPIGFSASASSSSSDISVSSNKTLDDSKRKHAMAMKAATAPFMQCLQNAFMMVSFDISGTL